MSASVAEAVVLTLSVALVKVPLEFVCSVCCVRGCVEVVKV